MEDQRHSTENQQVESLQRRGNTLEMEANRRKVQMPKLGTAVMV